MFVEAAAEGSRIDADAGSMTPSTKRPPEPRGFSPRGHATLPDAS